MQNRITVTIAGLTYTITATEDKEYMERVAAYVDSKIKESMGPKTALLDGAILAAINLADEHFKDMATEENLRRQLKEYLDDSTRMKLELSETKRELFKLQSKLEKK